MTISVRLAECLPSFEVATSHIKTRVLIPLESLLGYPSRKKKKAGML